jgi:hypothetical protein
MLGTMGLRTLKSANAFFDACLYIQHTIRSLIFDSYFTPPVCLQSR